MKHSERRDAKGLPVAVIGAGPIGLAAAAHLVVRGERPLVLEAGERVGSAVAAWGHVRMFSPWSELIDPVSKELLREAGWEEPDPHAVPTGAKLVERLLEPLASLPRLAPHLRLGHRVVGISRAGMDKRVSRGRAGAPFTLSIAGPGEREERVAVRAVIDASGTYGSPNPLGADGLPAVGEAAAEATGRIRYGIPDILGAERHLYAGRRTLVFGAGHSAYHAVLDLARLANEAPGTRWVWALRRGDRQPAVDSSIGPASGNGRRSEDPLPARAALEDRARELLARSAHRGDGIAELVTGFRARSVSDEGGVHAVEGTVEGEDRTIRADQVVVVTGYQPDLRLTRELRVELDPRLECPVALAPLIDPDLHDCGSVQPHGYDVLRHPEPDFYMVGMKSYGRAPSFLLLTGYEQVRSVVAALAGDLEEARRVRLTLPAGGVCSANAPGEAGTEVAAVGCCAPAPVPLETAYQSRGSGSQPKGDPNALGERDVRRAADPHRVQPG